MSDSDALPDARSHLGWLAGSVLCLALAAVALVVLWNPRGQGAPLPREGGPLPAVAGRGELAMLDGCMELVAAGWRSLAPAQRSSDLAVQPLRSASTACARLLAGETSVYVVDAGGSKVLAALHGPVGSHAVVWQQPGAAGWLHSHAVGLAAPGEVRFAAGRIQRVSQVSASPATWLVVDRADPAAMPGAPSGGPSATVSGIGWRTWLVVAAGAVVLALVLGAQATLRWQDTQRRSMAGRLAEEQRLREAARSEARDRQDVFDAVGVGLRVIDAEGRLLAVNPAFCAQSGHLASQLLGCGPPYPFWPSGGDGTHAAHLRQVLDGAAQLEGYTVPLQRPDGSTWLAHVLARPLSDGCRWILASADVTRERLDRQRIAALNEELRALSSVTLLGQRAGDLLHQFSNHCGTGLHALSAAQKHLRAQRVAEAAQAVDLALQAMGQLGRTVERFRPWLRDESSIEAVSLQEVAQDAVVQEAAYAAAHHVRVSNEIAAELPTLMLDRMALCEVLSNLIHNAVTAVREVPLSNRRVQLTSYLDETAGEVLIRVCDLGPGIPEGERERVFERGYTASRSGGHGGSGWGLPNCRYWVEKASGTIRATSHAPQGAALEIRLPFLRRGGDAPVLPSSADVG